MKPWIRKSGIFFACTVACAAITGITPFFPEVAVEHHIPVWAVGLIFAACPFASLLTSFRLTLLFKKVGRTKILLAGITLIGISNFLIALVEFSSESTAIVESLFSRILAGIGTAFSMMSAYASVTSDYAEEAEKMMAMIEVFCGLGLIMGPAIASTFYGLAGYFYSCIIVGSINLISVPILFYIIGPSRPYVQMYDERFKVRWIAFRPHVIVDVIMQFILMFCFGFLTTTTEFQLLHYGVKRSEVGYWYSIWTSGYLISCTLVSRICQRYPKNRLMIFGIFLMSLAFIFLGPCPLIFPDLLGLTALGLALVGLAAGFVYVPTVPHIMESLQYCYCVEIDDRVHDAMSALTNISLCLGEILGPILSSVLFSVIGYEYSTSLVACLLFCYAVAYVFLSDSTRYGLVENVSLLKLNKESTMSEELS